MKKIYLILLLVLAGWVNQAQAGWPIGKYRNVVIPSFNYYTSHDSWNSVGQKVKGSPGSGFTSYAVGLYVGYGISRRLDLVVNVLAPQQNSAYRNFKDSLIKQQSSGIGDMQVGLAYNLVNFGYKSFLSVMGSGIVPLYDTTKTVALGYAAYGAELKLMYSGGIDNGFLKHTYYNMEVGYRRYFDTQGPNVLLYTASLGIPLGKRNQIGFEGSGQYSTSTNKAFNPNLALNRDFSFTKASFDYGHTFTRRFSVFVTSFYTLIGRNTGLGYGGSVQMICKL
ncbi:hypothetical protein [Mucilaginibacter boryungensis]|uniref:Outer membrane protein beta-barrel domain-containing protein n=1 Tax=Mucilaginibacter boryungensis TaxID=768480 RepID=A0ABR9XIM0_9SPHI|nr:hypothetical protein [Mucilaginibacter boryungensis]MBE9667233.1 hypothetical protein [Mucilaginibacter boryungensis]